MTQRRTSVSASRSILASASQVFAVLADPRRHLEMDGSGMLRGTDFVGPITRSGEVFVMKMHYGPIGNYEMNNHVVNFEQDRRIAWEPESGRGHPDAGTDEGHWGHRWSFALEPDGADRTTVTETWDGSAAREQEDGTHWIDAITATLASLDALCTTHRDSTGSP